MKKRIMLFAIVMALMLGMLTVSAAADDAGAYEEMPDNFVILLDCSRSLETNDPQNLCLQACKNFVDKLPSQRCLLSRSGTGMEKHIRIPRITAFLPMTRILSLYIR